MPIFPQSGAISPCLVTGNINYLSGGTIPSGIVIFQLYNYGVGNLPQIPGISVLPSIKYPVITDAAGQLQHSAVGQ